MISVIVGKVLTKDGNKLTVLTAGGVGYEIMVSAASAKNWSVGAEVQILTYLAVRESSVRNRQSMFGKQRLVR